MVKAALAAVLLVGVGLAPGIVTSASEDLSAARVAEFLLAAITDPRPCPESQARRGYESRCGTFKGAMDDFTSAWNEAVSQEPTSSVLTSKTKWERGPEDRYAHRQHELQGNGFRVIYVAGRPDPPVGFITIQFDRQSEPPSDDIFLAGVGKVSLPTRVENVPVEYPEVARVTRLEGRVIIQATIRKDGTVTDPVVLREVPPGVGMADAAVQSVLKWRYEPAELDGAPVDVYYTVRVDFELED